MDTDNLACDFSSLLFLAANMIAISSGVERQAGKWGSKVQTSPTIFSAFQKQSHVNCTTLQLLLNNGAKSHVRKF
jgi:hypothetical protein